MGLLGKELKITWRKGKSHLIRLFLDQILKLSPKASQFLFDENKPMSKSLTILKQLDHGYGYSVIHPRDHYLEFHGFISRFWVKAKNISIDSVTGVITTEDGNFIVESSSWSRQDLELNVVHKSRKLGSAEISGSENVLLPSNGFYHWLIEDLPLFLRLEKERGEQARPINTYVYEFAPNYVRDFLHFRKINAVNVSRFADFNEIDFISRGDDAGWPRLEDIQILRETFLPTAQERELSEKIYVSRLKSSRSTIYEAELENLLAAQGWMIIYAETLSLGEQIQAFSQAKVLCGLHGAGLSGMIWMEKSSKVIEISRETMARACFARLATVCGLSYSWLNDSSADTLSLFDSIIKLSD
jgi:hypothetical protein